MLDTDQVALVGCSRTGDCPIDWTANPPVQYLAVGDLREAFHSGAIKRTQAKGAQEGFVIRLTWPAAIAQEPATVTLIDDRRLTYQPLQGRSRTIILAGAAGRVDAHGCPGSMWSRMKSWPPWFPSALRSFAEHCPTRWSTFCASWRAQASATATARSRDWAATSIVPRWLPLCWTGCGIGREDIFVRLEAAANLLRIGTSEALEFFTGIFKTSTPSTG